MYYDEASVVHAFRLSGGLESSVVGESQILGQIRSALANCQRAGTEGALVTAMNRTLECAQRLAERVGGRARPWAELRDAVADADVVVPLIDLDLLPRTEGEPVSDTDVDAARELVRQETTVYLTRRRAVQATPAVVALRTMAADVTDAELRRPDGRLPELGERERAEISLTVHRVVGKLLHHPTVRVRDSTIAHSHVDYATALRELFALDL